MCASRPTTGRSAGEVFIYLFIYLVIYWFIHLNYLCMYLFVNHLLGPVVTPDVPIKNRIATCITTIDCTAGAFQMSMAHGAISAREQDHWWLFKLPQTFYSGNILVLKYRLHATQRFLPSVKGVLSGCLPGKQRPPFSKRPDPPKPTDRLGLGWMLNCALNACGFHTQTILAID